METPSNLLHHVVRNPSPLFVSKTPQESAIPDEDWTHQQ